MCEAFPRVAACDFVRYGTGGLRENQNAICVLSLNMINDKVHTHTQEPTDGGWSIIIVFLLFLLAIFGDLVLVRVPSVLHSEAIHVSFDSNRLAAISILQTSHEVMNE